MPSLVPSSPFQHQNIYQGTSKCWNITQDMHVHERMLAIFIFRNVCFTAYLCLECKMQTIGPKDTAVAS